MVRGRGSNGPRPHDPKSSCRGAGKRLHLITKRGAALQPALAAAAVLACLAADAAAVPVTFTVTSQPSKQAHVASGMYSGSSSFNITGTLDTNLTLSGGIATAFDVEGAHLSLSDMTIFFTPPSAGGFGFGFGLRAVTATLLGPPALFVGSSGTTSSFDLAGSQLVFNSGTALLFVGSLYQLSFSQNPVTFDYGPGSIAELVSTPLADDALALTLLLPLGLDTAYPPGSVNPVVLFSMSGDLASTGAIVPEPSTAFLIAAGLVALSVPRRRS